MKIHKTPGKRLGRSCTVWVVVVSLSEKTLLICRGSSAAGCWKHNAERSNVGRKVLPIACAGIVSRSPIHSLIMPQEECS